MHAPKPTIEIARRLRRDMTPPEARLWMALRKRAGGGLRFRRQHPIGPYVLDFYCASAKLAVEVDGFAHVTGDHPERDLRRDAWLAVRGIRTLRIDARDVRDELDGVVGLIVATAKSDGPRSRLAPSTAPLPPSLCDGPPSPLRGAGTRSPSPYG